MYVCVYVCVCVCVRACVYIYLYQDTVTNTYLYAFYSKYNINMYRVLQK